MDFWKPYNKFDQNQGVVSRKIWYFEMNVRLIEGHKRSFYAFLHFFMQVAAFEAITCHVPLLGRNFGIFWFIQHDFNQKLNFNMSIKVI